MNPLKIGIQLYSLGPQFAEDAPGVLRALANMGYEGVEFAWVFGGLAPGELRDLLQELDLQPVSIYAKVDQLIDDQNELWTYADVLGCHYLTMGWQQRLRGGAAPEVVSDIEQFGRQARKRGLQLLYHNHCDELRRQGNTTALDQLLDAADPHLLGAELDVAYFVQVGLDPIAAIRLHAGRLPLLHARDTTAEGQSVPVGKGVVDFPAVIDAARAAGTEWLVVEQNPSGDALRDAETSIHSLRASMERVP